MLLESLRLDARPRRLDHLGFGRLLPRMPCDLTTPAILGDDDEFVQRLAEQGLHVLGAGWAAARVAGPPRFKAGVAWRLAVANLIIAFVIRRHLRPPPRRRGHQSEGRSQHGPPSCRAMSSSGEGREWQKPGPA